MNESEQALSRLTDSTPLAVGGPTMSTQVTSTQPFFQPRPEHDTIQTAYFLKRLADKVQVAPNGCWIWIGAKNKRGYGRIGEDGGRKTKTVHRVVYELCVAEVATCFEVCHNCPSGDNPSCCNPSHLFVGTHQQNVQDAGHKGKMARTGVKGEGNGRAKLTGPLVQEIRRRYAESDSWSIMSELAKEFGVGVNAISRIVNRRTWGHIA